MINAIIGQRLNTALALRGLQQKELAQKIHVLPNVISYICSGSRKPTFRQLVDIAQCLNVSVDFLLGLTGPGNYASDIDEKIVSDKTGLSNDSLESIYCLSSENKEILNAMIEDSHFIDALACVNNALTVVELSHGKLGDGQIKDNDLCFDTGAPCIRLSPRETALFFADRAAEIASSIIKKIVLEKMVESTEKS